MRANPIHRIAWSVIFTLAVTMTESHAASTQAPADQYFGRLKLSYIAINNTLTDARAHAGPYTVDPDIINKVALAESAFLDWKSKYPKDSQIPRTTFLLAQVYLKIWTTQAQDKAGNYLIQLRDQYPATYFGKTTKADLAKGFTKHVLIAGGPCLPAPGATPTPAPKLPTASAQKKINVQVISAPCVPATPSPSPSPSPTPVTAPAPSSSPSPISSATPQRNG